MILPVLLGTMVAAVILVWWERRLLGFWQDRLGPNRLGPFGFLQIFADMLKLFTKVQIDFANRELRLSLPKGTLRRG